MDRDHNVESWLISLIKSFGFIINPEKHMELVVKEEILDPKGLIFPLFDPKHYLQNNPDVAHSGVSPYIHYFHSGWRENRSFSALFDTKYYWRIRSGETTGEIDPLSDYARFWMSMDRSPSPLFDSAVYFSQNIDASRKIEPLYQYSTLRRGGYRHFPFNEDEYVRHNFDILSSGIHPLVHLAEWGVNEKRLEYLPIDIGFYNSWNGVELQSRTEAALHHAGRGRLSHGITHVSDAPRVQEGEVPDSGVVTAPAGRLAVGLVLEGETEQDIRRALRSIQAQCPPRGLELTVHLSADCNATEWLDNLSPTVGLEGVQVHREEDLNPAQRHNGMMRRAFLSGADYYLFMRAGSVLFPDAVRQLVRSSRLGGDMAQVEAARLPVEQPKHYDNVTKHTAWAASACMLLPRRLWIDVGGFDEMLEGLGADVDLSWRARSAGYQVLYCPKARFHDESDGGFPSHPPNERVLLGAWKLARKYGAAAFANHIELQMLDLFGHLPEAPGAPVRRTTLPEGVTDFDHGLRFSPARF